MGKQSAFFALYGSLTSVTDAIDDISGAWEDWLGGPTVDDWKDTDDLERSIARLDSLLASEQVKPIDEQLRLVKNGVAAIKQWLKAQEWLTDEDASDQRLEQSVKLLEQGRDEIEGFIRRMARRAFGYWGAVFFSMVEYADQMEFVREEMTRTGPQDLEPLLSAEDVPDEPIDLPPTVLLTQRQRDILKALDGKALKKEELAHKVCGASDYGNMLFRPGGIRELMALGMVENTRGIGYWSTTSPPPKMVALLLPGDPDSRQATAKVNGSRRDAQDELPY